MSFRFQKASREAQFKTEVSRHLELAAADACVDSPADAVADAGYFSRGHVELCESFGVEPLTAAGRQHHNRPQQKELPSDCDVFERKAH